MSALGTDMLSCLFTHAFLKERQRQQKMSKRKHEKEQQT